MFFVEHDVLWKMKLSFFIMDIRPDIYCRPTCLTGELRQLYTLTPIAVIGGSFLPGLSGHNISEAAAAGCAILTGARFDLFCSSYKSQHSILVAETQLISGRHVGHFSHMVLEMQQTNPLSVLQVGKMSHLLIEVAQHHETILLKLLSFVACRFLENRS